MPAAEVPFKKKAIRESSFNMTRGGDEDIEGGFRKCLDTRKGGSAGHEINFFFKEPSGS